MLKVNFNSPVPLYEQIVEEISEMIRSGRLSPGDSLPTIRSLASQLDIAVNTVARAYQDLERMNLIESRGRKGSFVKRDIMPKEDSKNKAFKPVILGLIQSGLERKDIENIFNSNMKIFFE